MHLASFGALKVEQILLIRVHVQPFFIPARPLRKKERRQRSS